MLDKPLRDHTLVKVICRVNRTFSGAKTHGPIVDYLGSWLIGLYRLHQDEDLFAQAYGYIKQNNKRPTHAAVDDLQATLDKAVSLGGKVVIPVTEIPGTVTMAMFADPEGNLMGIVKNQM